MEKIQPLRNKIDEIDEQTLSLLRDRVNLCRAIGLIKRSRGLPVKDSSREKMILSWVSRKAAKLGLDSSQVESIFREIIVLGTRVQESDEDHKN